jgi:hypothetical protein
MFAGGTGRFPRPLSKGARGGNGRFPHGSEPQASDAHCDSCSGRRSNSREETVNATRPSVISPTFSAGT